MASYEATIPSAWPADDTFGYLAVFSNAQEWDPGVLSGDALDPGPVRAGSRFRIVVPFLGRDLPLTYQVTEFSEQDRRVVLEAASTLLRARDLIMVFPASAAGHAAEVSYQAEVTPRGPLRLLDPVLSRGFRKVGDRAASGLRDLLARRPAPGRAGRATSS